MASDIPGRPYWSWTLPVPRISNPQIAWSRGIAGIGLQAMSSGGWTTQGGGIAPLPRSLEKYGVIGASLWSQPRLIRYSELLNQAADAYGAAVGSVPTRQMRYEPPKMPPAPSGLSRRAQQAYTEQWRSIFGHQLPIVLDVPAVGINNPVLPGSREDPRGPRRPIWR